jgi:hypothetical protein
VIGRFLLAFSRAYSRLVLRAKFRFRDRLSALRFVPARLDRSGEWYTCSGCGVRQKAGGVPAFYQPDGERYCFGCHYHDPEHSRRHYRSLGWTPGEIPRWPEDPVGEADGSDVR